MNKREFERRRHLANTLQALGFTLAEVKALRRISNTLQRWHEMVCGTGEEQVTRSIEREGGEDDGRPYLRVQYPTAAGYVDRRSPIPDREKAAKKRLADILARRNNTHNAIGATHQHAAGRLSTYLQTDPRGAALYILRPGDVPAGEDEGVYYSRGICVY